MTELPPLEVVVVAYGDPSLLAGCLARLSGLHPIVVDNSVDARVKQLCQDSGARYFTPGDNVGFAAGVNIGLAQCDRSADVLLLNPDAEIETVQVRQLQAKLHERRKVAAVAPQLRHTYDTLPYETFFPFPSPSRNWAQAVGLSKVITPPPEFAMGAVLLLRQSAIAEVGPFDERFFLYREEQDWQLRATRAGWSVLYCEDVLATHAGAGTETDSERLHLRLNASTEVYMRKWYGAAGWQSFRLAEIAKLSRSWLFAGDRSSRLYFGKQLRQWVSGPLKVARSAGAWTARTVS